MKRRAAMIGLGGALLFLAGCATQQTFNRPYERVSGAATIALAAFRPDGQEARHEAVRRSDTARRDLLTWGPEQRQQLDLAIERRDAATTQVTVRSRVGWGRDQRLERELLEQIEYHSEY